MHGDFQVRNILIDENSDQVNVIDWDWEFQEKGNPIYDFVWLATNIMMLSNNPEKEFLKNQNNHGRAMKSIDIIKKTMTTTPIDLKLLLKIKVSLIPIAIDNKIHICVIITIGINNSGKTAKNLNIAGA